MAPKSKAPPNAPRAPAAMRAAKQQDSIEDLQEQRVVSSQAQALHRYLPVPSHCPQLLALPHSDLPPCKKCADSQMWIELQTTKFNQFAAACTSNKQALEEIIKQRKASPQAKGDDLCKNCPFRNGNRTVLRRCMEKIRLLDSFKEWNVKPASDGTGREQENMEETLKESTNKVENAGEGQIETNNLSKVVEELNALDPEPKSQTPGQDDDEPISSTSAHQPSPTSANEPSTTSASSPTDPTSANGKNRGNGDQGEASNSSDPLKNRKNGKLPEKSFHDSDDDSNDEKNDGHPKDGKSKDTCGKRRGHEHDQIEGMKSQLKWCEKQLNLNDQKIATLTKSIQEKNDEIKRKDAIIKQNDVDLQGKLNLIDARDKGIKMLCGDRLAFKQGILAASYDAAFKIVNQYVAIDAKNATVMGEVNRRLAHKWAEKYDDLENLNQVLREKGALLERTRTWTDDIIKLYEGISEMPGQVNAKTIRRYLEPHLAVLQADKEIIRLENTALQKRYNELEIRTNLVLMDNQETQKLRKSVLSLEMQQKILKSQNNELISNLHVAQQMLDILENGPEPSGQFQSRKRKLVERYPDLDRRLAEPGQNVKILKEEFVRVEVEKSRVEREKDQIQLENTRLQGEKQQLEREKAEAMAESARLLGMEENASDSVDYLKELQQSYRGLVKTAGEREAENKSLKEEIDTLISQIASVNRDEKDSTTQTEIVERDNKDRTTQTDVAEKETEKDLLVEIAGEQPDEITSLKDEINVLNSRLASADEAKAMHETELEDQHEKIEQLSQELDQYKEIVAASSNTADDQSQLQESATTNPPAGFSKKSFSYGKKFFMLLGILAFLLCMLVGARPSVVSDTLSGLSGNPAGYKFSWKSTPNLTSIDKTPKCEARVPQYIGLPPNAAMPIPDICHWTEAPVAELNAKSASHIPQTTTGLLGHVLMDVICGHFTVRDLGVVSGSNLLDWQFSRPPLTWEYSRVLPSSPAWRQSPIATRLRSFRQLRN